MKNKISTNRIKQTIQVTWISALFNLLWFGMWMYIIFGLHQSGWWILFPLFVHFEKETK